MEGNEKYLCPKVDHAKRAMIGYSPSTPSEILV